MPRWFKLTITVATLAILVVGYFKPAALWTIAGAVAIFVGGVVAVGGEFAIALAHDHALKGDELTTLNLTVK